ncbi:MAG: hypothetical protein K8I03_14545, partial [Ignavibacteria bacterium]|nr:hypothetical protein [Ignavibacteria bacterium]
MKTILPIRFKFALAVLVLIFFFASNLFAQPQHYNFNTGGTGNNFPFNIYPATGKTIQTLYLPGAFNNPSPVMPGNITKIYFRASGTGNPTFTNLKIRMGLTTDTDLPAGAWYTGPMTTVLDQAGYSVSSTTGSFIEIPLTTPFPFDPTKSLVVEVEQCGYTGTGFAVYTSATGGGNKRHTGPFTVITGCPHAWYNTGDFVAHTGIDIAPAPVNCSYSWSIQTSGTTALLYTVKAVSDLVGWAAGAGAVVRRTIDGGTT